MELAIYLSVALLGLGGLVANSLLRRPEWLTEDPAEKEYNPEARVLKENWKRLTWYSAASGIIFGLGSFILNSTFGWNQQSLAFATVGGYLLFQSIFTDMRIRRVDRWGQRIANITALAIGAFVLSTYGTETDWVFFLTFTAAAFAIGLLPGIGDSDGRAFVFLVLATYPVSGISGLRWAGIFVLISLSLYYLGYALWKRNFSLKGLMTKFSFPMVPLIMASTLAVTLLGRMFIGS